jgi:LysR family cyn operon transcriptional activator
LEETLQVELFDRSGRRVQLTDAGQAWMRYARLALQDLEAGKRAIQDVATLERGNLRLAMTPTFTSYLIGPLVDGFFRRYPGITLNIREMTQDKMEALLCDDQLDLGIAFEPVHSADIAATRLFTERLQLMVGKGHQLAKRRAALSVAEVQQVPLVLLNGDFATRHYVDEYFQQHAIYPQVAMEANAISAIVEIVRHGQLATILPQAIARSNPLLLPIKLSVPMPERHAVVLQRKEGYRSAASRVFIEMLHERTLEI